MLPGGIVNFWNLDTQPPQVGPSFLGVKKERPANPQSQQGLEHGASSRSSQTSTPCAYRPTTIGVLSTSDN